MIKKIKIELGIISVLLLSVFLPYNVDIFFYNIFVDLNSIHLKDFFVQITKIGNSLWFFLLSVFLYLISFLFKKNIKYRIAYNNLKNFSVLLFLSVLTTGLLTQIIKHVVGRARPNHSTFQGYADLKFFSFDSSFHSFPSGHTSTIFVAALVMSLFIPKIKYFYLFFATLVAFSRVVVGAHFVTDIVGGVLISFIGLKTTLYFLKVYTKKNPYPLPQINIDFFTSSLIVFLLFVIFITVGNSIDIFISGLFYKGEQTFLLHSFDIIVIVGRKFFLPALLVYILLLPIASIYLPLKKIYFNFVFNFKSIFFIWFGMFFNLIFCVNILLKNMWGRARPNDIILFGGEDVFTEWFKYSESCTTNCSFVSGDASVGFSLIILFFLTKNIVYFWSSLIAGFFLGAIRLMEGGHFLSDIIIAGILIFILCFFQSLYYNKKTNNHVV